LQLDSVNIHPLSLYGKQELTYTVQYLFLRKKVMFGTTQMMTDFFPFNADLCNFRLFSNFVESSALLPCKGNVKGKQS